MKCLNRVSAFEWPAVDGIADGGARGAPFPQPVGTFSSVGRSSPDERRIGVPGASVTFDRLSASYGAVPAVRDVSLAVGPGEHLAVIGSNGSGKSTLLRCLLGLHRSTLSGTTAVDGQVATDGRAWAARRRQVAFVPQRPPAGRFPILVRELLASSGAPDAALAAADSLGLGNLTSRAVDRLSGGQVQRVFVARALGCVAAGADVLAADEPTSALDFDGQAEVAECLLGLPVTVLLVTHDASLARRCDRRVEMAGGVLREAA